jgi:heat shock protein HslJ
LDREWKLIDVLINGTSINFDRNALTAQGFGEIFTLTLGSDRLSGVAAPNRYIAPYTQGDNRSISVSNIAGTLMAPIREPDKLKESEFLSYIENAYRWNIVKNRLELSSKAKDGGDVVLVFSL